MSNFNRKKIHISYMLGLRNQEFPEVFGSICTILERAEITEPYLAECLQLAKTKEAGLKLLKNMNRKHLLTPIINELTNDRHSYFLSLRGKAAYGMKSPVKAERAASRMVVLWLDAYRKHLMFARRHEQNLLADQLADDMGANADLADAMEKMGLLTHFNGIIEITEQIRTLWIQRSEDLEAQSREADLVRREAYEIIKRVINALDMAVILDGVNSERYAGYWNEIARVLDQFNAKVLSRATRRKTASEKEDAENENEQPMEGDEDANAELDDEMLGSALEGDANMDDVPVVRRAKSKSTRTLRSEPYHVVRLNGNGDMGTDLQKLKEEVEEPVSTADAMNGSRTLINDDALLNNAATSGGDADDGSANGSTAGDNATGHSDADDLFQE